MKKINQGKRTRKGRFLCEVIRDLNQERRRDIEILKKNI